MHLTNFRTPRDIVRFGITFLLLLRSSLMPIPARLPTRLPRQTRTRRQDGFPEKVISGGSY